MNRRDLFRKTLATAVTLALGAKKPELWVAEFNPSPQLELGAFPTSYIKTCTYIKRRLTNDQLQALSGKEGGQ
jgi:hypothetical protein